MAERDFEFYVFRLNIVETQQLSLFDQDLRSIQSDEDILSNLEAATAPKYRVDSGGLRAQYEWAIRSFWTHLDEHRSATVAVVTLARSVVEREGLIVTDAGIVSGLSEFDPPLADTIQLVFYMKRHLVAVERLSAITETNKWRSVFSEILSDAAIDLGLSGRLELEALPVTDEVMADFFSFSRLMRLRVKLRLPNPELSRFSKQLYEQMQNGAIREYLQDMRNARGLSTEPGALPHASAEVAQAGYKDGSVIMEGVRDGRRDRIESGGKAQRGTVAKIRDFVRGIQATARAKETTAAVGAILEEIDRVVPAPKLEEADE